MNFDRTQQELLNYVKSNNIWKLFVPVAEFLLITCGLVQVTSNFVSIGVIGSVVGIFAYISIVMCLAKGNYKVLTVGLALRVIDYIIDFAKPILNTRPRLELGTLLYGLIWFWFLMQAYKKSGMTVNELKQTASVSGLKNSMNLDEAKKFNVNEAKESINKAKNEAMETINKVKTEMNEDKTESTDTETPNIDPQG